MRKKSNLLLIASLLLSLSFLLAGCSGEKIVQSGDTVKVDYTGKLSDGTVFDTSVGKQPLEFTLGSNEVIEGFETAVLGMKVGESKTVTIPAVQAYGERDESLVLEADRSAFPTDQELKVGMQFQGSSSIGTLIFTIIEINDTKVKVDGNHSLAGKDLTFEITLVEIISK